MSNELLGRSIATAFMFVGGAALVQESAYHTVAAHHDLAIVYLNAPSEETLQPNIEQMRSEGLKEGGVALGEIVLGSGLMVLGLRNQRRA